MPQLCLHTIFFQKGHNIFSKSTQYFFQKGQNCFHSEILLLLSTFSNERHFIPLMGNFYIKTWLSENIKLFTVCIRIEFWEVGNSFRSKLCIFIFMKRAVSADIVFGGQKNNCKNLVPRYYSSP